MTPFWTNLAYLLSRYLHMVCAMLLVGGTLFYEMVVPIAIDDLKQEAQLAVFARARWVFRWIVWLSAIGMIITGVVTSHHLWQNYEHAELLVKVSPTGQFEGWSSTPVGLRADLWWAAHVAGGTLAALVAVSLTVRRRPPEHPVAWMRLDLMILLIVIFLATATRQVWVSRAEKALKAETARVEQQLRGGTTLPAIDVTSSQ